MCAYFWKRCNFVAKIIVAHNGGDSLYKDARHRQ